MFYLTLWITYIMAPLELVYKDFRDEAWLRYLNIANDAAWIVVILANFFRHEELTNHFEIAKTQMCSLKGTFWIDILAVVPPLVYIERNWKVNACHLIRLFHFL